MANLESRALTTRLPFKIQSRSIKTSIALTHPIQLPKIINKHYIYIIDNNNNLPHPLTRPPPLHIHRTPRLNHHPAISDPFPSTTLNLELHSRLLQYDALVPPPLTLH